MLIKIISSSGMLVTRLGSHLRTGVRMFRTSARVFRDRDPRQRLQFRTSGLKEVSASPTLAQRLEWMTTMPGRQWMAMWAGWGGTGGLSLGEQI